MKNQSRNNLDAEHENSHHIAKKRKTEHQRVGIRNMKDKKEFLDEFDAEDLDYDAEEYLRYIK
jgi:hypothetical protein